MYLCGCIGCNGTSNYGKGQHHILLWSLYPVSSFFQRQIICSYHHKQAPVCSTGAHCSYKDNGGVGGEVLVSG